MLKAPPIHFSASDSLATNGTIEICIVLYCIVLYCIVFTTFLPLVLRLVVGNYDYRYSGE